VLVRPVAADDGSGTWPQVDLRHGETPAAAARRAVLEAGGPVVEVGRPRSVGHELVGGIDTLLVELEVLPSGHPRPLPRSTPPVGTGARAAVRFRRLAAYALVVVDERVLLTQLSAQTPAPGKWTLPGGGIDQGESPLQAVVREVHEETGHDLSAPRLLDVDSSYFTGRSPSGRLEDFHGVAVIYTGGVEQVTQPRVLDVGGSTAAAAWVPLDELAALPMSSRSRARLTRVLPLAGVDPA
jgi:8-oxo-dGTP pyrophosphatase MutT (NUDIX family)